jgi:hypothetical protein
VDHRVDRAELVHLPGDVACLAEVGQVTDDRGRPASDQISHRV